MLSWQDNLNKREEELLTHNTVKDDIHGLEKLKNFHYFYIL